MKILALKGPFYIQKIKKGSKIMEKIRIGNKETLFEIETIRPVSENVMQLVFPDTMPSVWGDITIYTDDGTEATTLTGYDTVYRGEGQTVYLSNDGSVYTAPETPEGPGEPPEPYIPTLEELQAAKRRRYPQLVNRLSIRALMSRYQTAQAIISR